MDRPWKRTFLGFSFTPEREARIRLAPKSIQRFKQRIRQSTDPNWSLPMEERIRRVNQYTMGWIGYFRLIETPSILRNMEGWVRRRLRLCLWLQWKRVRTRIRELRALGLNEKAVMEIANTRKGAWRTAKTPQLHQALGKSYWKAQGLKSLTQRYFELRQG